MIYSDINFDSINIDSTSNFNSIFIDSADVPCGCVSVWQQERVQSNFNMLAEERYWAVQGSISTRQDAPLNPH